MRNMAPQRNVLGETTDKPDIVRLRQMVESSQDDHTGVVEGVIGKVGHVAPLLRCKQVQAVCTSVDPKPRLLKRWSSKENQRYALYFSFQVVEPSEHEGVELMMHC